MGFNDFWINNNGKREKLNDTKHGVRKEQVDKKFHNLFDAYDVNGDGTLETEELEGVFVGLNRFAGADKTLDAVENQEIASLLANKANIKDADFMGFVRSISQASQDIVSSETSPTPDGGKEVKTTYKDGTVETISYYPDGEYKFKKIDQESSTTTNYYTIGNNLDKHYTATEIESRVKKAYNQRIAQIKQDADKNKPIEGKAVVIIPNYEDFKRSYLKHFNINKGSSTNHFERHDFELSERGKADVAVRDFVLTHYIESHKAAHDALDTMGILDDIGAAINAGAGEVWNSIKNVWKGTDEEYQNFYELAKKFEPNYNKSLQLKGTQELAQKYPENYFRGEVGKIDTENGAEFQQVTEQYQNAQILQQRLDILNKAMREISMYQSEQDALTYAPAQSEGMNPASHILNANNLLLEYFNGDKEAVNMILNGTIGNSEATIKAINGLKEDTEKLNKSVLDGKTFDQIQNDYKSQYKAMYGTDFVPDELTEKVMDAKATGGMVKLAAITAISVLITKSPIMTQMMGAAAGSVEATGAAANMIRTLTARYGATAVQQGIKFAMTSGTLATDVGLSLLNQATSERGVDGQELWESTKSSAKYIYFGSYIGAPLAQAVSRQLGKIGATARMFEGGVKTATGGIQTTTITGDKLVQNLMKGGNKVLTTGGAFLTDVAAFTGLEVITEGQDLLTAGKEQTEMLGKLKIMNHFIEYMLGGKVHAGMSKAKMDAAIENSGIKNWQIKEIKTPNKSLYEVQLEEGLPPVRFNDANELATAMMERVAGNYRSNILTKTKSNEENLLIDNKKKSPSIDDTNYELHIKPSEFTTILNERTDIPQGLIKTPEQLKLYDAITTLDKIKKLSEKERIEFIKQIMNNLSEASAQLDVIPNLIRKGYDLELIKNIPVTEANKNYIEDILGRMPQLEECFQKYAKSQAIYLAKERQERSFNLAKKELHITDEQLPELIEREYQDRLKHERKRYFKGIFSSINGNNIKYLNECLELGLLPSNLVYFNKDTAKIIKEFIPEIHNNALETEVLDRIHRKGHTYESVKEIFGTEKITPFTSRLLEFKNFNKFKDIGLKEFKQLSVTEQKEFLNSFISSVTTNNIKFPSQSGLDKGFKILQSKMKIFREINSESPTEMLKSYNNILREMLDAIPPEERISIQSKIETNTYRKEYRDANPIPPLVDDISKVIETRTEIINGKSIKVAEVPLENNFSFSTHRIPSPEAILNIEALEITDPNMFICVGTKGGSRGINGGNTSYTLITKPRKSNDLHVQAYGDIDSGTGATKNIYNFENIMLPQYGNHCDCLDLIQNLVKKKLNLTQAEYTKRMQALGEATTLQDVAKVDKELEQCIREIIKEQNLYEGIIRPDVMGISIPENVALEDIPQDILNYCERRNIPIIRFIQEKVPEKVSSKQNITFKVGTDTEELNNTVATTTPKAKFEKIQFNERQQKCYNEYINSIKQSIQSNLAGEDATRAFQILEILQDRLLIFHDGKARAYSPKVGDSDIITLARIKNLDINRLKEIVEAQDPKSEGNLGYMLTKIMCLSNEDYNSIKNLLGKYSSNIDFLYATTQINPDKYHRVKTLIENSDITNAGFIDLVSTINGVAGLSDEAWNNIEKRGLYTKLAEIKPSSYDATLKSLANMDENTWTKVNERNLLKKNALRHIDVLSMLTDAEFKKLIDLKAYNDETGELKVADKFIGEFLQLSPEQEQKLNDYDLLNRDSSQSTIKGTWGSVNAAQVLTILKMSEGDFQKLIDKNLFNIQINGRKLNTDEIIILGNQEPSAINKVMDIMSFNNKIKVKEALSISELSNENIAKIKKYNLFEEKVAPRLFSHDIDGDIVLMLSAFKAAKNGENTEMVNLQPAEIVKIAQMPESAIPKMLELLRNKNVEKYSFDDLMKIAKLDDAEFKKVLSIVDETKDDGHALLSYSLTENGDNARFNNVAYEQVRRFNEILDDPAHADIFIRYCQKSDGTHDAVIAERLIKALKNIGDIRLVSEVASIAKENNSGEFDIRFIDALEEAKNRGVSLSAFDLSLKECTDADGKFSQEIYNKIYELRASEIWEGGIPQILKACKNADGSFNNEVFQHAFKLKAMEHDNGRIGFILQAARDLDGNFSPKLLEEIHLEIYKWSASEFPKIINACLTDKGTIDRAVYDNLLKLLGSGRVQESDIIRIAPLFNGLSEYLGKNNINELSISEKRALLKKLVQFNAMLFDRQFGIAMKECLKIDTRLIPLSKDEYCALLPKLVKSIGIDTKPLSSEVTARYQSAMDRLSEPNGALAKTDFNSKNIHLELEYPREQFINQMIKLLNDLPPLERMKATDYFGFEIIDRWDGVAQMNGYPINVNNGAKMAEISDPATKVVIEKMRPFVDKFTNQNKIMIKDNQTLADELNDIVKAFPEFLTTIGRKQHGTHDFTIDIHTLKVLQGVITNPKFQQLSPADQRILQIATLMHDLTKAEGLVDKTHPQYSAYDTYYLLEKTNLSEAEKLKVYQLIKNHDWLERYNKAGTRAEAVARDIAFDLREGKLFEMASILAEADLKGVKANDTFYLRFQPALEKGNSKIRELVNDIQRTSIFLPQTKIPKASEIKIVGDKVKQETTKDTNGNPITNTVIYLDKDMDLSAIGFADGLKAKDLNVLVHALDYENQSAVFQALGQVDSDALLSSSYITYNKGNYHVFRTQGFILDVAGTDIHAGTYMDFGSGCGKDMQTLKSQYLFNGDRKIIRNFFSDTLKDMLKLSDAEYQKLYEEIGDKTITELDKTHPNIAAKLREMFDSMEVHKRSHGRDYNEILISRPQIQAVFWQGKIKDSDALKHSTKKYTIDRVPEFLRKYAADNDLPIIYFGE